MRPGPSGAVIVVAMGLAACQADRDAFHPETGTADAVLERRALDRVPPPYRPATVTVSRLWGQLQPGADTEIVGYDAWVGVEGCTGHVLVRFNRWGDHRTTGDLTKCP